MDNRQRACLEAMEIDLWVRRDLQDPASYQKVLNNEEVIEAVQPLPVSAPVKGNVPADADNFFALRQRVLACTDCDLHQSRSQAVFGVGDPAADWLIIGEAPGAEEDRQGEPFVGRAGQLLNAMLLAIGLNREQVFIANILKCRPPDNRDPRPEEVAHCAGYLNRQIELIQPKIILAVGRIAAQNLLNEETPIGKMRGKTYCYEPLDIPVVVTYHPAYLLRQPSQKSKTWDDLLLAKKQLVQA